MEQSRIEDRISQLLDAAGIIGSERRTVEGAQALERYIRDLAVDFPGDSGADKLRAERWGRQIALKNVVWELIVACASLLSSSAGNHVPPPIVTETAVVMAVANISRKIKRLDGFQLELLRAVASVCAKKANAHRILSTPGATLDEVRGELARNDVSCPADLEKCLLELVPEVLHKSSPELGETFFTVVL